MKKRHAALFAATVLAISCTGALAETTTNNVMNDEKYTSVVAQTLPDAEDMVIDYDNYYGQVIEGYYNYDCYVNENVTRSAKFYVPAKTVYNQPTVFIMVPSGVNTWGFFVESGWKDAADKYVFHVVLAETDETANGAISIRKWNTSLPCVRMFPTVRSSCPSPLTSMRLLTAMRRMF